MENWSNSTHRAHIKLKKHYTTPEPKEYSYEGSPVKIIDNYVRAGKRVIVIETLEGKKFEVFMEKLD